MKRKSTLILIAALVLAVTIPVFAFAAGYGNARSADSAVRMYGRGNTAVQQGTQLMLQDCDLSADCDCEVQGTGLGADGEALHQFTRNVDGQRLYLNSAAGTQTYGRMGRGVSQAVGLGNCPWID
ncbi:MAG: hypothetical protein JW811_00690 [Clostridiales bacterium]|nr:hypothetical protein [Clostridiales bacterium]